GQNQPRRDDFGLKIGKLSHRTSIKDGLGRHIGSCGPLNRNFPKSSNVKKHLAEFEAYRDRLISKVAEEFVEVDKAASVKDYRLQRAQRIAITGRGVGKRTLAEMYVA
ncbi:hypothetical protein ACFH1Q_21945, partial [Raoultella ornithinolytica]|uniref:hypothetical protein n=1 Tax=Raoultella ornithinolytica TaxID=54291 RepID=UPI003622CC8C